MLSGVAIMSIAVTHTVGCLYASSGGVSQVVPRLCDAMSNGQLNTQILYQTFSGSTELPISPNNRDIRCKPAMAYHFPRLRFSYSPEFYRLLGEMVSEQQTQIIHDHGIWQPCNHTSARVARERGVKLVTSPHGMLTKWAINHNGLRKKLALLIYQQRDFDTVDMFWASAQDEANDIAALGLNKPIAIVPFGIELPPILVKRNESPLVRQMLFLSRLHPKKGLSEFISAWAHARPQGWKVIIAGPDESNHQAELQSLVLSHNLSSVFDFVGPVYGKKKADLLNSAEILVLPSHSENFGVVVVEALAASVPVLTTTATPWFEINERRCGWCVPMDIPSLANAITISTNATKAELAEMGNRGREFVESTYSWDKVADTMRSTYSWLLNGGRKPDCIVT